MRSSRAMGRIRHAESERDAAACAAIYAPAVRDGVATFEEVPPTAAEMAARIVRVTATHPWLVEERGGVVVGYAYASAHHPRPGYRWTAEVAVYVDAAHHREGVGRRLYGELLQRMRAQGLRTACARITLPNPGSVALHEAVGFAPAGVLPRAGWKHGAWRDVGWWWLDLAPGAGDPPAEPSPPAR